MSDLTPEEQAYLASSPRCGQCEHSSVFHDGDRETCGVPGCHCSGIGFPSNYAEYRRIAKITAARASARSVEQAVDQ